MKQLQRQFDTPLFVASGRRLIPTEAALRAALQGMNLVERIEELGATAPVPAIRDMLRLGVTPSAALVCGPALHFGWCHERPRRRIVMSSADEERMLADLQAGELDLVVAPLPRSYVGAGLSHRPLYQLEPLVYARRDHALAQAQALDELHTASWAVVGPSISGRVDVLHEALAVRQMWEPRVVASCPDYTSLLHLMIRSNLLGVLPHPALLEGAAAHQVVSLRLREALPRYEMNLFTQTRRRRVLEPVIAELQRRLAPG